MTDFKIGNTTILLNKLADYSKPKLPITDIEPQFTAYRGQFHDMVNHIKMLADVPWQQNKVAHLKQVIADDQYKIDYDELIEQLLVEES